MHLLFSSLNLIILIIIFTEVNYNAAYEPSHLAPSHNPLVVPSTAILCLAKPVTRTRPLPASSDQDRFSREPNFDLTPISTGSAILDKVQIGAFPHMHSLLFHS